MFPAVHSHSPSHRAYHPELNFPSLISPQSMHMDPTAVDFRAFYPYTPNEVKHRKRTTSAQLKILEGIFKRDTKPNAVLRNELAAQLDMTARGVQVWFQNRRAKEKNKANKNAATTATKTTNSVKNEPNVDCASSSPEVSSQESSPTRSSPPHLHVVTDSATSSYQSSPLVTPDDPLHSSHLHFLRRGSLPANSLTPECSPIGPQLVGHLDPFSRRRSVDASLHRLAANPYAQLARAKNGAICAPRISGLKGRSHRPDSVPEMPSATVPPYHTRHASADSRTFGVSPAISGSPSPSPLSYYPNNVRASLPDNNLYAFSSRPVGSPIPGPLPAPGFSFGAASTTSVASPCSADSDRSSPDPFRGFSFRNPDDLDTEDDHTSASYDAFSRFGSIASIATDSSNTSAYYSDEDHIQSRRESCTSGFLGLMSNLDVNSFHESYSAEEGINATAMSLMDNQTTSTYPSPCSTVSPRSSPLVNDGTSTVPVSRSSELAYALQSKSEPVLTRDPEPISYSHHSDPPSTTNVSTNSSEAPFFYMMNGNYASGSGNAFGDFDSSQPVPNATGTYDLGYPTPDSNAVYAAESVEYVQHDTYPSFTASTVATSAVTVASGADFSASFS